MANLLSDISSALTGGKGGINVFHLNVNSSVLGFEGESINAVSEGAKAITDIIGRANQLVHTAYCIGEAITHPAMLKNILDRIGGNLAATALDIATRICDCIGGQIQGMFSTVAGTVLNVVNSVLSFLNSILGLVEQLEEIWKRLMNLGKQSFYKFMAQEDCEFMLAQMSMCMLNKLFGDKLTKMEQKVTKAVSEQGQKMNSALADSLADTNSLANYVKHESFMVDKATQQLNFFNS